jgi:hypothetical protein
VGVLGGGAGRPAHRPPRARGPRAPPGARFRAWLARVLVTHLESGKA